MATIVVVGGYGVVGLRTAQILLGTLSPEILIVLAGRNPDKARESVVAAIGEEPLSQERVRLAKIDINQPKPLENAGLSEVKVVLGVVFDEHNHLLEEVLATNKRLVDITRGVNLVHDVLKRDIGNASVIIASSWMGGLIPLVAAYFSKELKSLPGVSGIAQIDLYSLFDDNDATGPDTSAAFDDLGDSFVATENGKQVTVHGFSDAKWVTFPTVSPNQKFKMCRINNIEMESLPQLVGCRTATMYIGSSNSITTTLLSFLVRTGLLKMMPSSWKRSLMSNPRPTATATIENMIVITPLIQEGSNADIKPRRILVRSQKGQAFLTAVGVAAMTLRLLGEDGEPACGPGFFYPESAGFSLTSSLLDRLRTLGAEIVVDEVDVSTL